MEIDQSMVLPNVHDDMREIIKKKRDRKKYRDIQTTNRDGEREREDMRNKVIVMTVVGRNVVEKCISVRN